MSESDTMVEEVSVSRLQPGDPAPSFTLAADDGSTVSSDGLAGERYVLYFYPKDDTPGCTTQACGLRDSFGGVTATGVQLFGVSPDSVAKHVKFREKYGLPFHLLSDRGHELAEKFGVWIAKSYAGRSYFGNERSTFIIGSDGKVEQVLAQVKPAEHVDQLLAALGR